MLSRIFQWNNEEIAITAYRMCGIRYLLNMAQHVFNQRVEVANMKIILAVNVYAYQTTMLDKIISSASRCKDTADCCLRERKFF